LFSRKLLHWHIHINNRKLVWKGEKDPYKIWISEIILQQTRVQQGEKYYLQILQKYPHIELMAKAPLDEFYRLWQGLGYYNRCKNMWLTAQNIVENYKSVFPNSYFEIRKLKGIGNYTAAAISSFAFDLPYAVVDGNVVRVLSRHFGLFVDFKTSAGKKYFEEYAYKLIDKKKNALYNQAIMDLGAQICKPSNPLCCECPLKKTCIAFAQNLIEELPIKTKKQKNKIRHFHFILFEKENKIFVQKRDKKDIWANLYTPFAIETGTEKLPFSIKKKYAIGKLIDCQKQKLTHQTIYGYFYSSSIFDMTNIDFSTLNLVEIPYSKINSLTFPRMIISFFQKNNYL